MARSTIIRAYNNTGSTLAAGTVVYISGFDDEDQMPTVAPADNRYESKMPAVGVVREKIENGNMDVVKVNGPVMYFDTSGTTVNDNVYVGQNGAITFQDPSALDEELSTQQIGTVRKVAGYPDGELQLFPLEVKRRIKHPELIEVYEDQHHFRLHAERHRPNAIDEFLHARQHEIGGGDVLSHSLLADLDDDVHTQYSLIDGTRAFTGTVGGITPISSAHLTTKGYVDAQIPGQAWRDPVIDKDLSTPPILPSVNDRYIVKASGTGAWVGHDNELVEWNGASWGFVSPDEGHASWVMDEEAIYVWSGAAWLKVSGAAVTGSGTIDQVAFWTSASSISSESNLFWDSSNNRLGIRINSPSYALDVAGDVSFMNTSEGLGFQLDYSSGNTSQRIFFKEASSGDYGFSLIFAGSADPTFDGTAFTLSTNNFYVVRHNGSADGDIALTIERSTGNIGIGTSAPQNKLDVEGAVAIGAGYSGSSTAPSHGLIVEGNVGIGQTSATEKLEVNGAIKIATATSSADGTIRYASGDFEGRKAGAWVSLTSVAAGAHTLGGASHIADTLVNLNSKVSDATLIDTGDSRLSDNRIPTAHDLAGAKHNSDTLANLNLKISDATLIDTGDSRLSDDRIPTAHDLAGAKHNADTLANLNLKVSDATLIDTADARLSDDRTASGIRTATTTVSVSIAAAPTVGQVLKATSGTAATWQDDDVAVDSEQRWIDSSQQRQDIRDSLDGYALEATEEQRWTDSSEQRQDIRDAIDGYGTGSSGLEEQRWIDSSEQRQDLRDSLDGYALEVTEEQRWVDSSEQRQGIRDALDGYGTGGGTGDITGSGADGYVTYWTGEKTVSGSEDLYFDDIDGYLGIGTTALSERLTVDGAISMLEASEPVAEDGLGKIYVNAVNGRLFFKMENEDNIDLTKFDIDGGSFTDTFETTNDFDAGSW